MINRFVSDLTLSDLLACTYNAVVSYGSGRGHKKIARLIEALNYYSREQGKNKLQALVDAGIIESFNPCPDDCCIRPGGLFHVAGCENDTNHPVSRARTEAAQMKLPGGLSGNDGWGAANITLVGQ